MIRVKLIALASVFAVSGVSAQMAGDLLWQYEIDANYLNNHPTVGPDGTVYVSDYTGSIYAISPDGQEKWTRDALGGQQGKADEGPIAIFPDGTVLVATNPLGAPIELVAYSPDGTELWVRTFTGGFINWFAGPNIGPDGHAYLAASAPDADSQVFAIDQKGNIVWESPTSPPLFKESSTGSSVCFVRDGSEDLLLFHCDHINGGLFAIDADTGSQEYLLNVRFAEAYLMQPFMPQVVANEARDQYYVTAVAIGSSLWAMRAFDADGSVEWTYDPGMISQASAPAVGADGTIFVAWDLQYLAAVEPDGSERWQIFDNTPISNQPAVSPDGGAVVVVGFPFGQSGRIEAFDTIDGDSMWETTLTLPVAGTVYPSTRATFSNNGDAVYVGSSVFTGADVGSFVYAYAAQSLCAADTNGDGILTPADFSAWVAAFNASSSMCDQNDDGSCTPADFSAWVANFNAGC